MQACIVCQTTWLLKCADSKQKYKSTCGEKMKSFEFLYSSHKSSWWIFVYLSIISWYYVKQKKKVFWSALIIRFDAQLLRYIFFFTFSFYSSLSSKAVGTQGFFFWVTRFVPTQSIVSKKGILIINIVSWWP